MNSPPKEPSTECETDEGQEQTSLPARQRAKNTKPSLPEDYKELCALCRAGKLFAVQEWFKTHKYREPERYDRRHWPMGIAIEKGFHSLVYGAQRNSPAPAQPN
jgi:hypothetical protein